MIDHEVTNRVMGNIRRSILIVSLAFSISIILFVSAYLIIGELWYLIASIAMFAANIIFVLYVNNIKNKYINKLKELERQHESQ